MYTEGKAAGNVILGERVWRLRGLRPGKQFYW